MLLAVSEITREVDRALLLLTVACVILLAGITIAMVLLAVRFRRGRTGTTRQIEGHKWLEVIWIVIPTVIVTWMFFVGYRGFALMREVPEDAMVVEVTGRQWLWSFRYPAEKLESSEMVVPVGVPIRVELTAPPEDVIHSFYIPDFRVKEDAVPGKETHLWFQPERIGTYNIFCAEFCGKDHSQMITLLKVVEPEEYDAWIEGERAKRYRPLVREAFFDPSHPTFGRGELDIDATTLYKTFCRSCHGESGDGSGLPGVARNFTEEKDWKNGRRVADIYRTLTQGIKDTQMRAFPNLTPWERVALAHHVRTFMGGDAPPDSPDEVAALFEKYGLDKVQAPGKTIPVERAMEILSREAERAAGRE